MAALAVGEKVWDAGDGACVGLYVERGKRTISSRFVFDLPTRHRRKLLGALSRTYHVTLGRYPQMSPRAARGEATRVKGMPGRTRGRLKPARRVSRLSSKIWTLASQVLSGDTEQLQSKD